LSPISARKKVTRLPQTHQLLNAWGFFTSQSCRESGSRAIVNIL
jgi:hypothetical protein